VSLANVTETGRVKRLLLIVGAVAVSFAAAVPAFGGGSGSLALSIEVATPCLTVGPSAVSFPSRGFSVSAATPSTVDASPRHTVTNCTGSSELLFVRGSNAAGTGAAAWALVSATSIDTNKYGLALHEWDAATATHKGGAVLSLQDQALSTIDPARPPREFDATLTMPTVGSDGAGQTMSMSVTYTATF
jgi:hypothetical protein